MDEPLDNKKMGTIDSVGGVIAAGAAAVEELYKIYKEKVEDLEGRDISAEEFNKRVLVEKGTNGERAMYWKGQLICRMGAMRLKEDGTGMEVEYQY